MMTTLSLSFSSSNPFTIYPYQSLYFVSPFNSIQCLHKVFVDWSKLVCPYVGDSRRRLLMSLSLLYQNCTACLAHLGWFVRSEVSGHIAALLWGTASRICSKQYTASLCSSHLAFFYQLFHESQSGATIQ